LGIRKSAVNPRELVRPGAELPTEHSERGRRRIRKRVARGGDRVAQPVGKGRDETRNRDATHGGLRFGFRPDPCGHAAFGDVHTLTEIGSEFKLNKRAHEADADPLEALRQPRRDVRSLRRYRPRAEGSSIETRDCSATAGNYPCA
jgi:hypothetical protein